jgi:hypothetical protein
VPHEKRDSFMARHVLLVHTQAHPGREEEFHAWYDGTHVPDVLAVPGFVSARRFRAEPSLRGDLPSHPFLALYEIETDDLPAALTALRAATAAMEISTAMVRETAQLFAYSELEPRSQLR